jgi:hypothetical protein
MKLILAASLLALSACSSTSEVMQVGRERYMVSATMGGNLPEWNDVKKLALDKAQSHCVGMGKQMESDNWRTSGARGWSRLRAELTFRCF